MKFGLFVFGALCLVQATTTACLAAGTSASIELQFDKDSRVVQRAGKQGATLNLKPAQRARAQGTTAADGALAVPELLYEGGTEAQRAARVVPDPITPGNWVMEFWVGEPNVQLKRREGMKSRVQMNTYDIEPAHEVYESVRLLLPEDMRLLAKNPEPVKWFTISEWWNNPGWTKEPYPFRISVHLRTAGAGSGERIFFGVEAQAMQSGRSDFKGGELWEAENRNVEVPIGRWIRLEYYYRLGKGSDGRFALAITPEGGKRVVVFDMKDTTYHPSNPSPAGLRYLNPIKLYTSGELTEFVRKNGGALRLYWDDVLIRACGSRAGTGRSECLSNWER